MDIQFHLPRKYLPEPDTQEAWKTEKIKTLESGGKIACAQCWIYQTWIALQKSGFPARLVHEIPADGILVALTGCVPQNFHPPRNLFFAGVVADYLPHPRAHLHIVQNSVHARRLRNSAFMPLWPHPNLIPRDDSRGAKFENVCFYGDSRNLAPELNEPCFAELLKKELGLNFVIRGADLWHDYSDADCVVAIRDFKRSPHLHKPATKLYNAWIAGVPFIGGMDSAFAGDGQSDRNFLQASSPAELISFLKELKNDARLRTGLVAAGKVAVDGFTPGAIVQRWQTLLGTNMTDLASRWFASSPASKAILEARNRIATWLDARIRR